MYLPSFAGDPLKDTSGPSLNILIKLMAVESLVFAPFFRAHTPRGALLMLPWHACMHKLHASSHPPHFIDAIVNLSVPSGLLSQDQQCPLAWCL